MYISLSFKKESSPW